MIMQNLIFWYGVISKFPCLSVRVRGKDGMLPGQGLLEVYYQDGWITVSDKLFLAMDKMFFREMVCRSLGYT